MRVETQAGLIYDDNEELCSLVVRTTGASITGMPLKIAIVTALDKKAPRTKTYWGEYCSEDEAVSIERILTVGGKWSPAQ